MLAPAAVLDRGSWTVLEAETALLADLRIIRQPRSQIGLFSVSWMDPLLF
jgi:hypothetical protein